MDNWAAEVQHHAPPVDPYSHHIQYASHQHSLYQNPNPNQGLRPPGVDPAASASSLAHSHGGAYNPSVAYVHHQAAIDASGYYQDPNAVNALQNWAAEVLRYHGSNPNATGVTISPNGTKQSVRPHARINALGGNSTWKRTLPKKTKIAQSAWCEVCKIECNSKDVLDQHKMGKKHQKNMEKLNQAIAPPCVPSSGVSVNPVIGPQANPDKGKATRKKAAEPVEDLEAKRRKIMEGGAAADAVRLCTICNVVCNSELVFAYHMAGKKHASMMKKQAVGASVTAAT
ncbi:uncharacterized protein LOC130773972 [Actinidia eriantha]|uniref:uncharacterized protein LOC130773972 n=1 Tax=Actinidia eriantha TaxID=165200 RepID=UPI00258BD19D|nr:uncharacterized protein LOC130773972 [Actinidia eriantha]